MLKIEYPGGKFLSPDSSVSFDNVFISDTAYWLHLMCCISQKSKELVRALLHAKNCKKHAVEPALVAEKVDTI